MRRSTLYGTLALCLSIPTLIPAQTTTHEEEAVRNSYAKLTTLCGVETATRVAQEEDRGISTDQQAFNALISKEVPNFTLSDFQTGTIASIADQPWGDFVTPVYTVPERLEITGSGHNWDEQGNPTRHLYWLAEKAVWTKAHHAVTAESSTMEKPVSQVITSVSPSWFGKSNPVTFTRYAAFTVDVSLDGKSTAPHKALWLFGTDSHGKQFVAENDLISGTGTKLSSILAAPEYPSGLLQTKLRENPNVSTWLRSNEMPAASCGVPAHSDLCCSKGRCGISPVDFNRDMPAPLPPIGGQQ